MVLVPLALCYFFVCGPVYRALFGTDEKPTEGTTVGYPPTASGYGPCEAEAGRPPPAKGYGVPPQWDSSYGQYNGSIHAPPAGPPQGGVPQWGQQGGVPQWGQQGGVPQWGQQGGVPQWGGGYGHFYGAPPYAHPARSAPRSTQQQSGGNSAGIGRSADPQKEQLKWAYGGGYGYGYGQPPPAGVGSMPGAPSQNAGGAGLGGDTGNSHGGIWPNGPSTPASP